MRQPFSVREGFTLVEVAVMLLIVGLVTGGILVGTDLARIAKERAQIKQIDEFNSAYNFFQSKYGALPGDMDATLASQNNFTTRAGTDGSGDQDGTVEMCGGSRFATSNEIGCEQSLFWADLTKSGFLTGSYPSAADGAIVAADATTIEGYMPTMVSNRYIHMFVQLNLDNYKHWYIMMHFNYITAGGGGSYDVVNLLPVASAYAIDTKIDDGEPLTGYFINNRFINGVDPNFWFQTPLTGDNFCTNSDNHYNLANTAAKCMLAVRIER